MAPLKPTHAPVGESSAPGGPSPSGGGRLSDAEVTAIVERDAAWTARRVTNASRAAHDRRALLEDAVGLREYVAEDSECTCGCPVADHERYDEGLACEHEGHDCLPCCPSIATMLRELRATVERRARLLRDKSVMLMDIIEELERKDGEGMSNKKPQRKRTRHGPRTRRFAHGTLAPGAGNE